MNTFNEYLRVLKLNTGSRNMPFLVITQDSSELERILYSKNIKRELFDGLCDEGYNYLLWKCYELADIYNLNTKNRLIGRKVGIPEEKIEEDDNDENKEEKNITTNKMPGLIPVGSHTMSGIFNQDYSNVAAAVYTKHEGVDWITPVGTNIVAKYDATVVDIKNSNAGYGNYLILQDTKNPQLFYLGAHMDKIEVGIGDTVKAGQIVGTSGNTGAGGTHFHTSTSLIDSENYFDGYRDSYGYIRASRMVDPYKKNEKWRGKIKRCK
jgi:hypothetical protein